MPTSAAPELRTERLLLRRWRARDEPLFAAINADPLVMATLGPPLTRAASDTFIDRIESTFGERGWGLYCVEVIGGPACIGHVGLWPVPGGLSFAPAVEIGWRLASEQWGNGYATEGARAVLADAFGRLALDEVVSITAAVNARSRAVMERLGLQRDERGDFEHPLVPEGDRLRPHVLYRLSSARYRDAP